MPIDPSIITQGLRIPQPQDTGNLLLQALQIQGARDSGEMNKLKLSQAQQGMDDQNRLRQILGVGYQKPEDMEAALTRGGFLDQGLKVGKDRRDNAKTDADTANLNAQAEKHKQEIAFTNVAHGTSILSQAKDPASYGIVRNVLAGSPQYAALLKQLPDQYDPTTVGAVLAQGMEYKDKLAAQLGQDTLSQTKVRDTNTQTFQQGELRNQAVTAGAAASNAATARQRLAFEQSQPQGQVIADQGLIVDRRSGKTMPILDANGQPLPPKDKALTESQGKAAAFATRAASAHDILNTIGDSGKVQPGRIKGAAEAIAGTTPFVGDKMASVAGGLTNFTQSGKQQQVEQAQRDFINAVLRLESGASISPSEFENAKQQYFPQMGDSAEVIAQKARNRATEIEGLRQMAGPHAKTTPPPSQASSGKINRGTGAVLKFDVNGNPVQ